MLELASLICETNKSMSPVSAQIYLKYSRSSGGAVTVWGKKKLLVMKKQVANSILGTYTVLGH